MEGEEDGRRVREDEFGTGIGCATGNLAGEGLNFRGGGGMSSRVRREDGQGRNDGIFAGK